MNQILLSGNGLGHSIRSLIRREEASPRDSRKAPERGPGQALPSSGEGRRHLKRVNGSSVEGRWDQRPHLGAAGRWLVALLFLVPSIVLAQGPDPGFVTGPPVPYRLTRDSGLTISETSGSPGSVHEGALSGTFVLVPLFSPLDWDNYALETVRLQSADAAEIPFPLCGEGFYSVGGRLTFTKQMGLRLWTQGDALQLIGGPDPVDPFWPTIDMTVTGVRRTAHGVETWTLSIVAVPEHRRIRYRLLEGSWLLDDCSVCRRPTILEPMRGGFDLSLVETNPFRDRHRVFEMNLGTSDGRYRLAGEGTFEMVGEFALTQAMSLDLDVDGPSGVVAKTFTNETILVNLPWPLMDIEMVETEGTSMSTLHLRLLAAPVREVWFSTNAGFTPAAGIGKNPPVGPGDLLSDAGHVVAANGDLLRNLGLEPGTAGLGVDALDVVPGAEILFSLDEDAFSESLGPLQHGDLLSNRGQIVLRNQDLMKEFGLMPVAPDVGLDAVQVGETGEVLFSIGQPIFSENLGRMLESGDLLSSSGTVYRTNAQLLSQFRPETAGHDYGLDALFVWPGGEIWFSTKEGFQDLQFGPVGAGDLLSDRGLVVFRNRDLVGAFQPAEDLDDFGTDALFIVTDLLAGSPPGRILRATAETMEAHLEWDGTGRVFQVERGEPPCGPFDSASTILPEMQWTDPDSAAVPAAIYRVRQW